MPKQKTLAELEDEITQILAFNQHIQQTDPLYTFQALPTQQAAIQSILGTQYYENYFLGSNRSGKTKTLAYCGSYFARKGLPEHKTFQPTHGVVVSLTRAFSQGTVQPKYFDNGTGNPDGAPFIPKEEIASWNKSDQLLSLKCGSTITFKAVESDREKFQGFNADWIHFDEECPFDIFSECQMRVGAGRRLRIFMSATLLPQEGMVGGITWLFDAKIKAWQSGNCPYWQIFSMPIYENTFLLPEELKRMEAMYPPGSVERRIRMNGELIPGMGSNLAYGNFDSRLHVKKELYKSHFDYRRPLCWVMDFNWTPLTSMIGQFDGKIFRVFEELILERGNVIDLAKEFMRIYPKHGAQIWIYGDTSGDAHSVQSGKTNYDLIIQTMQNYDVPVRVKTPTRNPYIVDRLNAVNRALMDENGYIGVEIDSCCEELIKDFEQVLETYEGGKRKIKKTYNQSDPYFFRTHACVAGDTLITTPEGQRPIKDIRVDDYVLLPTGKRRVEITSSHQAAQTLTISFSNGTLITCTPEHKFLTEKGLVYAGDLQRGTIVLTGESEICQQAALLMGGLSSSVGMRDLITALQSPTKTEPAKFFTSIATYGHKLTELFQKATTSIISMKTPSIIPWTTLNVSPSLITCPNTENRVNGQSQGVQQPSWTLTETKPQSGTEVKKDVSGIANTLKKLFLICQPTPTNVNTVVKSTPLADLKRVNTVPRSVKQQLVEPLVLTMKNVFVKCVQKFIPSISTRRIGPVVVSVETSSNQQVYDLTIERDHCYLANGLLVSNSDAFGYWLTYERPVSGKGVPRQQLRIQTPQYSFGS